MNIVKLRPVEDTDRDVVFGMMRDPEAVRMAAFTAADPDDRVPFKAHLAKLRFSPDFSNFGIVLDDRLVGTAGAFSIKGDRAITYWVGRAFWGRGIESQALYLLVRTAPTRPLTAQAASSNARSIAVLKKNGFVKTGWETSFAQAAG